VVHGLPIDIKDFTAWLGGELGPVRAELAYQESQPARQDKRKKLKGMMSHVSALRELLDIGNLAVSERAVLREAAFRRGANLAELMPRMRADLSTMEDILAISERRFDEEEASGGRPAMVTRDRFLLALADRLRPAAGTADNTCDLVEKIAILCRIPVPSRETIARMLRQAG
jgi:hypothetical protein